MYEVNKIVRHDVLVYVVNGSIRFIIYSDVADQIYHYRLQLPNFALTGELENFQYQKKLTFFGSDIGFRCVGRRSIFVVEQTNLFVWVGSFSLWLWSRRLSLQDHYLHLSLTPAPLRSNQRPSKKPHHSVSTAFCRVILQISSHAGIDCRYRMWPWRHVLLPCFGDQASWDGS